MRTKKVLAVLMILACVLTAMPESILAQEVDLEIETEETEAEDVELCEDTAEYVDDDMELQTVEDKCGENASYILSEGGTRLNINGNGPLWQDWSFTCDTSKVQTVFIATGITNIYDVFKNNESLKNVYLPNTLTAIEGEAFKGCTKLEYVDFAKGATQIKDYAFNGCSSLKSITIPSSVAIIGKMAFCSTGLTSIELPEGVKILGDRSFAGCTDLEKVTIPMSIETFGEQVFYEDYQMWVTSNNDKWYDTEGNYYEKIQKYVEHVRGIAEADEFAEETYFPFDRLVKEYPIPDVPEVPFKFGDNLTYALSNDNKTITISGQGPMYDNINKDATDENGDLLIDWSLITKVVIGDGVTTIGDSAFAGLDYLEEVVIPEGLEKIGNKAFYYSGFDSITIPNSVVSIGDSAFQDCLGLKEVEIGNGVTSIGDKAFCGCSLMGKIDLPNNLEYIGESAFEGCSSADFSEISIPSKVKRIYKKTFRHSGLSKVSFAGNVIAIDEKAFEYCKELSVISLPASLSYIGRDAFLNCDNEKLGQDTNDFGSGWCTFDSTGYDISERLKTSLINDYEEDEDNGISFPALYRNGGTLEVYTYKIDICGYADAGSFIGKEAEPTTKSFSDTAIAYSEYTFYVKAAKRYEIVEVSYIIDAGKAVAIEGVDGKYTIPGKKIVSEMTITVTSRKIDNPAALIDLSECTLTARFADDSAKGYSENSVVFNKDKAQTEDGIVADELVIKDKKGTILTLEKDTDYSVSYQNNKTAGTAYVTVTADPASEVCKGSVERAFTIKGGNIGNAKETRIDFTSSTGWNGKSEGNALSDLKVYDIMGDAPVLLTDFDSVENKALADYRIIYSGNQKPGKNTATIIGLNAYDGSKDISFTINKPDFKNAKSSSAEIAEGESALVVIPPDDRDYNGQKNVSYYAVLFDTKSDQLYLDAGRDYTVTYKNNINAGTATMTVKGKGNYTGQISRTFNIRKLSFDGINPQLNVTVPNMAYNKGKEVKPNPVVTYKLSANNTVTLKKGKDYDVEYLNNKEITTGIADENLKAKVVIKGKGNYEGTFEKTFEIVAKDNDINKAFVFDVKSADAKAVLTKSFTGAAVEIEDADLAKIIKKKDAEDAIEPVLNTNYKVSYSSNVNAGKAKVTITGIGACYGTKTINMTINKKTIASVDEFDNFEILFDEVNAAKNYYYTGYAICPDVAIKDKTLLTDGYSLEYGRDYTVSFKNNTNASTDTNWASVIITFKGNYAGKDKTTKSITKKFKIQSWTLCTDPAADDKLSILYDDADYLGGKKEVKPVVTIKYADSEINPKAYKITYDKNTDKNPGKSVFKIEPAKGLNDKNILAESQEVASGTKVKTVVKPRECEYTINKGQLDKAIISDIKPQVFKGKAVTVPKVTVKYMGIKLIEGTDYTVFYLNNNSKGLALYQISAVEGSNYLGANSKTFIIK